MKFIGLQTQIRRNNFRSILLLLAFPVLIFGLLYGITFFGTESIDQANDMFIEFFPFVTVGVGVWFIIAYFSNTRMIKRQTKMHPLSRKENMYIYNLTENLCMSVGMKMPKLFVIESNGLNAFASGINEKTFAVTITTGLINHLNEKELEGVIAHELTHIRNNDVKLQIVAIIFVGIFSLILEMLLRVTFQSKRRSRRSKDDSGGGMIILIALAFAAVGYFFSLLFRFALSRKREFLADAGAVELTKNAGALASALRKISQNPKVEVKNSGVKELFIDNGDRKKGFFSKLMGIFSTHPPIEDRIEILEKGI